MGSRRIIVFVINFIAKARKRWSFWMKDFVLINFQDNLSELIPWRSMPCMSAYNIYQPGLSADCFIIIKLFDGTLAMIQTSVMSVITLHLCTLFNQPRHHFPAPSLRKLLSSKSSSNSDLPSSTISKHRGVPAGDCALFLSIFVWSQVASPLHLRWLSLPAASSKFLSKFNF